MAIFDSGIFDSGIFDARIPFEGSVSLVGAAELSAAARRLGNAAALLAGAGLASAAGELDRSGGAALVGSAGLSCSGAKTTQAATVLAGNGQATSAGARVTRGAVALFSGAGLGSTAIRLANGGAVFAGVGAANGAALRSTRGAVALAGIGSFNPVGRALFRQRITLSAQGAVMLGPRISAIRHGVAGFAGSGIALSRSVRIARGNARFSAEGRMDLFRRVPGIFYRDASRFVRIVPLVRTNNVRGTEEGMVRITEDGRARTSVVPDTLAWVVPMEIFVKDGGEWRRIFDRSAS